LPTCVVDVIRNTRGIVAMYEINSLGFRGIGTMRRGRRHRMLRYDRP